MPIKTNILIVDDDEFVLSILQKALEDDPEYHVVTASDGVQALNASRQENFDLIITDIIMPEKNGIEFINELRESNQNTPVIAISGGGNMQEASDCINFASYFANESLTKPFTKTALLQTIQIVLNDNNPNILEFL